ncbi:MAG TPA: glycine betaine ABC transporter substrate-binding protein [Candidatus Baltobacteraceae bacterium]|jgi:glycine betaine/choline ABC-type transport system substrate-binding protein
MTRAESLRLGLGLLVAGCGARRTIGLRVASTGVNENAVIAEVYAAALERANIRVERHIGYGDAQSLMGALRAGKIDVFPGYVPEKLRYEDHDGVTFLEPSPATEGPCVLTSQVSAERFWLVTLTRCARIAPRLRLAATRDFLAPNGGLQKLQSVYGGFHFKSVTVCDDGDQYGLLNLDDADVANGSSTDAQIAQDQLGVLSDPKSCFPASSIAPIIRVGSLDARGARVLNRMSQALNEYAVQRLNMQCDLGTFSARFLAEEFVIAESHRATPNRAALR